MRLLPLLFAAVLSGCTFARYNTHMADIQTGMDRAQVTRLLGKPQSAEGGGNEQMLHYRIASSILDSDGSDTREYWVHLTNGRVDGYGERNDAASQWRSRQQYNAAWNALGSMQSSMQHAQESNLKQQEISAYRERTNTPAKVHVDGNIRHDVNGTLYLR